MESLDLLPSSIDLIDLQDRIITAISGEYGTNQPRDILKRRIRPLLYLYDYIIIDCPPNMGLITQNGLMISDAYIIPTIPDVLSTYGIPQIVSRIRDFSIDSGSVIHCLGVIATKYKPSSSLHERTLEQLARNRDADLFRTVFNENNQLGEAAEYQEVSTLRQKWGYQGQYEKFVSIVEEILERWKDK